MTTTDVTPDTTEAPVSGRHRIPVALFRFAGAALLLFPVLFSLGMVFSPPQLEEGEAGYIQSLAADPAVSILSATFLHYAWVALALGVVGVVGLVATPRGRTWVAITSVVVAFGAVQMSGLLLSDWFLVGMGTGLPIEDAVAVDALAKDDVFVTIWGITGQVAGLLGILALSLGLARARVVSWWIAPLPLLAFVVPMFNLGPIAAVAFVPLMAPVLVAGVKLLRIR
jgi:hypothetical protein